MGIYDEIPRMNTTPDAVVPLLKNLNNEIYLDSKPDSEFNIFKNVSAFIATEFTKVKFVFKNVANEDKLDYMLNLRPNKNQTGNQLLYDFAFGLLKRGYVYYKITKPQGAYAPTAIEVSQFQKTGFTKFDYKHLKMDVPTKLTEKYTNLISELSTRHTANLIEFKSKLKGTSGEDDLASQSVQTKMDNRLRVANHQIQKHGKMFTFSGEETKDHQAMTQPDSVALGDLKTLIYEHINISPKLLNGSYNEEDYRAFYAKHIRPLIEALQELLNSELVTYQDYSNGSRIEVILDLMQFATLESFTKMAKEGLYAGYLQFDTVRGTLGLDEYPDEIGKLIFSNKNAVALNDDALNEKLATGGTTNNEDN